MNFIELLERSKIDKSSIKINTVRNDMAFKHITKLDHIVMRVTNIEKSIHFYRDILGCPEKRISDGLYQYQAGASMIDLVPIKEDLNME